MADDINVLLDSLRIDQAIIGGLSRGGSIATAFYDEYPERTLALILADGGSVSWVTEIQKLSMEEARHKIGSFTTPDDQVFATQREAYYAFNYYQDTSKQFRTLNGLQKVDSIRWSANYRLKQWLWEDTPEHIIDGGFRPTTVPLFEASTTMLYPKIVYRNLDVPMLIFDPVEAGDWLMDFEDENKALQSMHPNLITHLVYQDTNHNVQADKPERFISDLLKFISNVTTH